MREWLSSDYPKRKATPICVAFLFPKIWYNNFESTFQPNQEKHMSNRSIAKKDFVVDTHTFTVRIDNYEFVEKGHYVKVDWSVRIKELHESSSLTLQDGDPILKEAGYNPEEKTLKPRILALKLFELLSVEEEGFPLFGFDVTFGFYDKRGHGTSDMLIGNTIFIIVPWWCKSTTAPAARNPTCGFFFFKNFYISPNPWHTKA